MNSMLKIFFISINTFFGIALITEIKAATITGGVDLFQECLGEPRIKTSIIIEENLQKDSVLILPEMGKDFLLTAINKAQHSVDITAYKLTDPDIISALSDTIKRKVRVRVLVEPNIFKHAHAINEKVTPIDELTEKGFSIFTLKIPRQMHCKMMVVDNTQGIVLTCNYASGTFNQVSRSRNFAAITYDKNTVEEMSSVFESDIGGKLVVPTCPSLSWGPENQRQRFTDLITGATKSIWFYQQSMKDTGIRELLVNALRRGVKVNGIMSPYPFDLHEEDGNIKSAELLENAGGSVCLSDHKKAGGLYVHAKVLIIDPEDADSASMYMGSCNFYTPSLDCNRELGIIIRDIAQIRLVHKVFEADFGSK